LQGEKLQSIADNMQQIQTTAQNAQKHLDSLLLAVAQWEVKSSRENAGRQASASGAPLMSSMRPPKFSIIRQITASDVLPVSSGTEPGAKNPQETSSGLQGNAARQRPRTLINPFRYAAANASNAAHSVAAADAAIQALNSR
jgi:hypothetical protein